MGCKAECQGRHAEIRTGPQQATAGHNSTAGHRRPPRATAGHRRPQQATAGQADINQVGFCVVATFKNEAEILAEWLSHYLNEGCAHFFLIDNGSTDDYARALRPFADKVELVVDATLKEGRQSDLYNHHFLHKVRQHRHCQWTVVCDLDEFIYARGAHGTIADYLLSLDATLNVTQVAVPWKLFGHNGYDTLERKEPASRVDAFTNRTNYDKATGFQGVREVRGSLKLGFSKSIVRSSALTRMDIHTAAVSHGRTIQSDGTTLAKEEYTTGFVPMNEEVLRASSLNLNHYNIRSLDYFTRKKR